jgi:arylsulfatase A-like enzyme
MKGAGALGLASLAGESFAAARQPNILFILADDLGYADLGCYGQQAIKTPVLDRLARDGMRLTQAYANSAVCSATRTALLTGRYQQRLPIGLYEPAGNSDLFVPPDHPTIATLLRARGYKSSLVGKWHLGAYPAHNPQSNGYDYCFGFVGGASDYFRHSGPDKRPDSGLWENDRKVDVPGYLTDILANKAIERIAAHKQAGAPFFMSLHLNAPHWPWEGPNDAAIAATITNNRDPDRGNLAKYGEMVEAMDSAIGRVLAALRQQGLERDTIVIFSSDNGGERFSDVWPLTGAKGELLEGGIRVPAILRWPARVKRGQVSEQVAISMDWLPTLLAAAGGAPDPAYPSDGMNILPILLGQAPIVKRKLFWRYKAQDQAAVRDGDVKFLLIGGREYLFNVVEDAHERANLKNRDKETFERLKADFAAWNAQMLPYPPNMPSDNPKQAGTFADRY